MRRWTAIVILVAVALPALLSHALIRRESAFRPQIPLADRDASDRVFLERADVLTKAEEDSFMILVGNVVFTKGGMIMKCDSAHYYSETESLDAFGHVSMEQGDTLEVTADELDYDGLAEVAVLYADEGKKVRLRNRDVTLETDVFVYDLAIELGYYECGGTLRDPQNTLTSTYGEYAPPTKEANFYDDVHLFSRDDKDTLDIYSDTLYYNTVTHVAELDAPSTIVNSRATIYTTLGLYDTDSNYCSLYERSLVVTPQGQTIRADSIYYDREMLFAEAFGDMVLTDSAHRSEIHGEYGYYDQDADSSFVTGNALLLEVSKEDTLFLHGRYIQSFRRFDTVDVAEDTLAGIAAHQRIDTTQVAVAFPRVRFWRRDMQGVCDSMRFTRADSTLRMFIHPIIWSEQRQIFGTAIELKLNDSTIERAVVPEAAFTAQHIEGDHYDQLSGKEMIGCFEDGQLRRLNVNGNVEIIMYPEENDSTINKMVNAESSYLEGWFRGRETELIRMWPATTGTVTPMFLARPSQYYLSKFKWYEALRPVDKDDIFVIPDVMNELMARPIPEIPVVPHSLARLCRIELPQEIGTEHPDVTREQLSEQSEKQSEEALQRVSEEQLTEQPEGAAEVEAPSDSEESEGEEGATEAEKEAEESLE